ncbi:hypothetical protein FISHEDRAFT_57601 [Fistulina hepatica ATCC 64428]|uniref:Uncharacterized protein n=1 Tax=Fistulina hepatica ATCC 64428 TaxID=1128425 RepID=A0A0D7AG52_9AGAR|nr:hypothetical protein FISHEDRAFT_57601 [Fistulina hepatica ATCC 64428]
MITSTEEKSPRNIGLVAACPPERPENIVDTPNGLPAMQTENVRARLDQDVAGLFWVDPTQEATYTQSAPSGKNGGLAPRDAECVSRRGTSNASKDDASRRTNRRGRGVQGSAVRAWDNHRSAGKGPQKEAAFMRNFADPASLLQIQDTLPVFAMGVGDQARRTMLKGLLGASILASPPTRAAFAHVGRRPTRKTPHGRVAPNADHALFACERSGALWIGQGWILCAMHTVVALGAYLRR